MICTPTGERYSQSMEAFKNFVSASRNAVASIGKIFTRQNALRCACFGLLGCNFIASQSCHTPRPVEAWEAYMTAEEKRRIDAAVDEILEHYEGLLLQKEILKLPLNPAHFPKHASKVASTKPFAVYENMQKLSAVMVKNPKTAKYVLQRLAAILQERGGLSGRVLSEFMTGSPNEDMVVYANLVFLADQDFTGFLTPEIREEIFPNPQNIQRPKTALTTKD